MNMTKSSTVASTLRTARVKRCWRRNFEGKKKEKKAADVYSTPGLRNDFGSEGGDGATSASDFNEVLVKNFPFPRLLLPPELFFHFMEPMS